MRTIMRRTVVCGSVLALLMTASAYGGLWTNSEGTADSGNYRWENGGDDAGLFTDITGQGPVSMSGDNLFFNLDFSVVVGDPAQTDTMHMDLYALNNMRFAQLRFVFVGYYNLGPSSSATATATLVIDELEDPPGRHWDMTDPEIGYETTPASPFTGPGSSNWEGDMAADLSGIVPPDLTEIHIDLSHTLEAMGIGGNINTQQGEFRVEVTLIPEPGSLALLAMGGLALLRRRR